MDPDYVKKAKKLLDKININIMMLQKVSKENTKSIEEIEKLSSRKTQEKSKNNSDIIK